MTALIVLCWIATAAAFIDGLRRPASDWATADRSRAFWLTLLVFFNAIAAGCYVLFVLPKMGHRGTEPDAAFLKR